MADIFNTLVIYILSLFELFLVVLLFVLLLDLKVKIKLSNPFYKKSKKIYRNLKIVYRRK